MDKNWFFIGIPIIYILGRFLFTGFHAMTPDNTLKSPGIIELNVKEKWLFWCLWLEMILPLFYCLTQLQEFPDFQLVWGLWICVFALSIKTASSICCFSIESPLVSLAVAFLDIPNILYNVNYLIYLNRPDLQISWKPLKSITFFYMFSSSKALFSKSSLSLPFQKYTTSFSYF